MHMTTKIKVPTMMDSCNSFVEGFKSVSSAMNVGVNAVILFSLSFIEGFAVATMSSSDRMVFVVVDGPLLCQVDHLNPFSADRLSLK